MLIVLNSIGIPISPNTYSQEKYKFIVEFLCIFEYLLKFLSTWDEDLVNMTCNYDYIMFDSTFKHVRHTRHKVWIYKYISICVQHITRVQTHNLMIHLIDTITHADKLNADCVLLPTHWKTKSYDESHDLYLTVFCKLFVRIFQFIKNKYKFLDYLVLLCVQTHNLLTRLIDTITHADKLGADCVFLPTHWKMKLSMPKVCSCVVWRNKRTHFWYIYVNNNNDHD